MVDEHEDFIRIYEGLLNRDQAHELRKHLKRLFDRGFGVSRKRADGSPKTERDDLQIWDIREVDGQDYKESLTPLLNEAVGKYVDEFDILAQRPLGGWWIKAQLTRKGEGYHDWHFESSSFFQAKRVLAWTIYVNDDYEGGELEFLYYGRRVKPTAGDLVIFPAAFTHAHRGNMVLSGEKLVLTGWYELVPDAMAPAKSSPE